MCGWMWVRKREGDNRNNQVRGKSTKKALCYASIVVK